ncbi:MAG: BppU family phage baseplate upper protein [Peptostreptococcaceae bacterium]
MAISRSFPITLDFATTNVVDSNIKFKQYDFGANYVDISVEFNSEPMSLEGMTVMAVYKSSKGNIIIDKTLPTRQALRTTCQVYNAGLGKILMPVDKQILNESGIVSAELVIFNVDNTVRITSPAFNFNVVSSLTQIDPVSGL